MTGLGDLVNNVTEIEIGDDVYYTGNLVLHHDKDVTTGTTGLPLGSQVKLTFEGNIQKKNTKSESTEMVNVDFDKTLTCPSNDEWAPAHKAEPNEDMIEAVQEAYFNGTKVIVWTARQWDEASKVAGWLTAHDVPFHGLQCGKGGSDLYVDDKAIKPEEFIDA